MSFAFLELPIRIAGSPSLLCVCVTLKFLPVTRLTDSITSLTEKKCLRPVENVNWFDCILFCNRLTEILMGRANCFSDVGFRVCRSI